MAEYESSIEAHSLKTASVKDSWVNTISGERIYLKNPIGRNFYYINDIAHALANICRFNGNIDKFYSVAEHSVHVSMRVPQKGFLPLQGLMHDASEAYMGDVITPLKWLLPDYIAMEKELLLDIFAQFQIPINMDGVVSPAVKTVDRRMMGTEARDLIRHHHPAWLFGDEYEPYDFHIHNPMSPDQARDTFLMRWAEVNEAIARSGYFSEEMQQK